ncbi:hypothetical protein bpSLO_001509 (plasmid) [Borrelia parkeri]|nr:hypothetical protein bpSLO_001509 [Borrelia parkeri]
MKIDTKFNELDNKIDTVRSELRSDIKDLDNKIDVNKMELDNKLDKTVSEFKSTSRLHNWMFGTLITLNIGIFLALMSLLVK